MSDSITTPAPAISKLARRGQVIAIVSAMLILGYGLYLIAVPAEMEFLLKQAVPGIVTLPGKPVLFAAAIVAALPAVVLLYGLFLVWKLFGLAAKGKLYAGEGQALLTRLGWLAIIGALCGILVRAAVALLMTSANPPGQKMLVLGIDSGQILSLIVGVLFFVFARVLAEAAALARENQSFI